MYYVMLATTLTEVLASGHPTSLTHYATFDDFGFKDAHDDYSTKLALPTQAIVEVLERHDADKTKSAATLFRAKLATEAVNQYGRLVVLGDPGGGKSTFMRHLAWALAERGLDRIESATALYSWNDDERLLPVVLPLRKLAGRIAREGGHVATVSAALRDEMEREYDARRADDVLDRALARGAALLLFDGLDEVPLKGIPGVTADRITTLRSVREFCELHSSTRVIVTCRTRAFSDELRAYLDWQVITLAPFTLGQIRHFTHEWYAELVKRGSLARDQADVQQRTLVAAVTEQSRLQAMGGTPLLLTMMALVLYEKGVLLRDRPTLYENILEQLLGVWDQQKGGESLASVIGDDKVQSAQLRDLVDKLSYDAHGAATSADGHGRLPRRTLMVELSEALERIRVPGAWEAAKRCLAYFDERSGLLLPEDDGEQYAFAHLTLQEYCAGRHLLLAPKAAERVMERRADDRWREPILLGIGAIQTQYAPMAERIEAILLRLLSQREHGKSKSPDCWYRDLSLAYEIGQERDWDLLRSLIDVDHIQDELRSGLVALLGDQTQPLPLRERVRAGFLLGGIGDPRFPVTIEEWQREIKAALINGATGGYLRRVPPGRYAIGSTDDDPDADDEKPQHTFEVTEAFWIGRFPITNAQWQAWVEAGGKRSRYTDVTDVNTPNQPVTGVDWYQCVAFCQWLSDQLDVDIRLPHEQEWEAAARGGDTRCYPWGDVWQSDHAATKEDQEIRGWRWTVPVGCYPQGKSPIGASDMAGNVWEWTADDWHSYEGAMEPFHDEYARVLRGGSYGGNRTNARCGARLWGLPDVGNIFGFRVVVAPRVVHLF